MTLPMWLTWLLREDVREGRQIDDEVAQRDFVAWWLLYGRGEYPRIWSVQREQAEIALEPIAHIGRIALPRIVFAIWLSRPDLQQTFTLRDPESLAGLLCWYRIVAPRLYMGAVQLGSDLNEVTEAPSEHHQWKDPPTRRLAVALWQLTAELQRVFDVGIVGARATYADWFERVGRSRMPSFTGDQTDVSGLLSQIDRVNKEFGVNLVGFVNAEFGLGEDVRMVSMSLEAEGVPHVIVDAQTPTGVRGLDRSRQHYVVNRLEYPITIHCMSPFDTCKVYLERGAAFFSDRYNIAYWPWELPRFPPDWKPLTALVSEIWASTVFQLQAYRSTCTVPVLLMPPAVHVDRPLGKSRRRPGRPFSFIYPFDPRSYLARKNPVAAIRAFRQAFSRYDRGVELVLRVNGSPVGVRGWSKVLCAARGDARVRIIIGTFDREHAMSLLQDSGCLVSPHRSEGFGRNIAEAIALGVPVIATSFSGSSDYLESQERLAHRFRLIARKEYPFSSGQHWCEPSIKDLARLMQLQRSYRPKPFACRRRAERFLAIYSPPAAGRRYRDRLEFAWKEINSRSAALARKEGS